MVIIIVMMSLPTTPLFTPRHPLPLQYVTDVDSEVSKRAIASIGLIATRVKEVAVEMTQQ